ncbi:shikimate dehydrogenase family protein [Ramlibacter sp. PS4R-6]|uniref:shikimate dehydrogenase family protein n=1 Tax=Ramlibacter sp. PS4R-6 TaxID=3133438 RepID=UPI0030978496
MRIDGRTEVIAHLGYPTHTFKSPMIYNPWFEREGINALVVPMACKAEDFAGVLPQVFRLENVRGALITMPHKVSVLQLLDDVTPAVKVAGACNAVKRADDGRLVGDQFDGEGFVRGVRRKGFEVRGARALVVGCGGVGSAIAAALAGAGAGSLVLFDVNAGAAEALAARLRENYPKVEVAAGGNDPSGFGLVVNATPLGMYDGDPLPVDVSRLAPGTFVGEVVMKDELTAFLRAAQDKGCRVQVGTDMLFEMIPAYLEFFGLPAATPEALRATARLEY